MPLSLYVAEYSAASVYTSAAGRAAVPAYRAYEWAVDESTGHALPIAPAFYRDLFRNGTDAGMLRCCTGHVGERNADVCVVCENGASCGQMLLQVY